MSMLSRYATVAGVYAPLTYVGGTTAAITGSASTTTNVSLTSLTGGAASAPADGDLVVVYYGISSTVTRTPSITTSGYTEAGTASGLDAYDSYLLVSYKRMTSTPDTQVTVGATGSTSDAGAVAVQVWRGVDSLLPLEQAGVGANGSNSVLCNPPAITPVTPGVIVVAGGVGAHNAGVCTFSSSDLSNFLTVGGPDSSNDATIGVGSRAWSGGAINPAAFTFSASSSLSFSWAAVTIALLPQQTQVGPFVVSVASKENSSNSSSLVISKPTGTREGDLMLALMNSESAITWTGDTGWTEVADQGVAPSTRVAYKVAGASEGASYTFTSSSSTNILSGTIVTYRNAAYDAIGTIQSGTDPLALSATASAPYSRFVSTAANAAGTATITAPAGVKELNSATRFGGPTLLVAQDTALSAGGASGSRNFTMGTTTNVSGVALAVKPSTGYTSYATYAASASGSATSSTSVSVNTPKCFSGNVLLLIACASVSTSTNITFTTPSGWTLLNGAASSTNAYMPAMYVFYRVVDGTEATSYSVTASTTAVLAATMLTLVDVNSATLTAGTTNSGGGVVGTQIPANGVTAEARGLLLYLGSCGTANLGPYTFSPPSGMTEAIETTVDSSTSDMTLQVSYQENMSAGATGTKTATLSSSAGTYRWRTLCVTVGPT